MTIIAQGAEATIIRVDNHVIKERVAKQYRIPEIDGPLRQSRTRREARILEKLEKIDFPSPKLQAMDDKKATIEMTYLDGEKLADLSNKTVFTYAHRIGELVAILHHNDIIHGDLTTSNMIAVSKKLYIIDYGLSFVSKKNEAIASLVPSSGLVSVIERWAWRVLSSGVQNALRGSEQRLVAASGN